MSGLSCARYFDRIDQSYGLLDTREYPPGLDEISKLTNCEMTIFGELNTSLLNDCKMLVVSPGISLSEPFVVEAITKNVDVCGDIELFSRGCDKPIIAITGSNGKSTVTDLAEKLINAAGLNCQKGGNIGLPALDFLPAQEADIYVLELSSFQLDTTRTLKTEISVLLNVSEDHMDRYDNFSDYVNSKQKIFRHAEHKIFNWDDKLTHPTIITAKDTSFSVDFPDSQVRQRIAYLKNKTKSFDLVIDGELVINTNLLQLTGRHNWLNVLSCLSILQSLNLPIDEVVLNCLKNYQGLPHRFQRVSQKLGCDWINDSKATNVGATVAAIDSIVVGGDRKSQTVKIILIVGGDSKQSDLRPLVESFERKIHCLILLGKDAKLIAALTNKIKTYFVENMEQAVIKATQLVSDGDIVLLSPACSSLDMYKNFEARGDAFIDAIEKCA